MPVGCGILLVRVVYVPIKVCVHQVWDLVFGTFFVECRCRSDVVHRSTVVLPFESYHFPEETIFPYPELFELLDVQGPVTAVEQCALAA